jgi:hypothetical protein
MSEVVSKTVVVKFNDLHQPMMEPPDRGSVILEVHDGHDNEEVKYVRISGSGSALRALGILLLGMSDSAGYHVHFDEAADGEWFRCDQGFTLTIENTSKPATKGKRTTDHLPPDWARG